MLKTILVPLDGSALAERALPYAVTLARATGAHLFLTRAALARTLPGTDAGEAEVEVVEDAEGYLTQVVAQIPPGVAAQTGVFYGDPVTAILEETSLREADLIAMATHGRSGLGRWVYGSVAEGVIQRSPVPVLLVRAWHAAADAARLVQQPAILVPLDGSRFAEAALPVASRLAQQLGGNLVLTEVLPGAVPGDDPNSFAVAPPYDHAAARATAEEHLRDLATRLATDAPGVQVRTSLREGNAVDEITMAAEETSAALVVMATHGRSGLDRLLLGSVAGGVVRQGRAPLLLVRPPAPSAEEAPRAPTQTIGQAHLAT